jgi:hypothetical protein
VFTVIFVQKVKNALREACATSFTFEDYRSTDAERPPSNGEEELKELDGLAIFEDPDDPSETEVDKVKLKEREIKYEPSFQVRFSFTPSPKKNSGSDTGGSQDSSQEEKILNSSTSIVPRGLFFCENADRKRPSNSSKDSKTVSQGKRTLLRMECSSEESEADSSFNSQSHELVLSDDDRESSDVEIQSQL